MLLPSGLLALLAGQLLHGPITREQVEQTLRRIVVEAELEVPVRLRSSGRAAGEQVPFIREERGFNVTGVGSNGRPPSSAPSHIARLTPSPSERRHKVRRVADHR